MSNKVEDFLNAAKLGDLIHKEEEERKNNKWVKVLAVIGGVVAVAGIAYAVYRFFAPDYLEDFEDEFDDDDDFFEEDDMVADEDEPTEAE